MKGATPTFAAATDALGSYTVRSRRSLERNLIFDVGRSWTLITDLPFLSFYQTSGESLRLPLVSTMI